MATVDEIRALALALPESTEADHFGARSFRVRGRIFATLRDQPIRLMVKLDPEDQRNLIEGGLDQVSAVPGYWGRKGSTFVDPTSALPFIEGMLRLGWSRAASARLRRLA